MCTFTLIKPTPTTFRIAFNRDEQRTRPPGIPPVGEVFGNRQAILPRDPIANGTWLAVNDAGLAMALLNVYPKDAAPDALKPTHRQSRGLIIPSLLHHNTAAEALDQAKDELDLKHYSPFTLMLADSSSLIRYRWDGTHTTTTRSSHGDAPFMAVSSGLGDALVLGPRQELFAEMIRNPDAQASAAKQDAFHAHRWQDHPELSVCMERWDARTISWTTVTVSHSQVELTYYPEAPGTPCQAVTLRLDRVVP